MIETFCNKYHFISGAPSVRRPKERKKMEELNDVKNVEVVGKLEK